MGHPEVVANWQEVVISMQDNASCYKAHAVIGFLAKVQPSTSMDYRRFSPNNPLGIKGIGGPNQFADTLYQRLLSIANNIIRAQPQ